MAMAKLIESIRRAMGYLLLTRRPGDFSRRRRQRGRYWDACSTRQAFVLQSRQSVCPEKLARPDSCASIAKESSSATYLKVVQSLKRRHSILNGFPEKSAFPVGL